MESDYIAEYETFMNQYRLTEIGGEEVGLLIVRMAGYFARYNMKLVGALKSYNLVIRDFQTQTDPATSKPMSSAKSESLAAATPEAFAYEEAKVHVQNIEQFVNALKALQRGVLTEYSQT